MLQPTRIGGATVVATPQTPVAAAQAEVPVAPAVVAPVAQTVVQPVAAPVAQASLPAYAGQIVLTEEQLPKVYEAVGKLDFPSIPAANIIQIGFEAERGLQQTLDGFLARLDKNTAAKVFELFGKLQKGVADTNLPDLLSKVKDGKPGMFQGLLGKVRGKSANDLAREAFEETRLLISGKTKTLADTMTGLETQLSTEMQNLFAELSALDQLKQSYRSQLEQFAFSAAVAQLFLAKAKRYVEEQKAIVAQANDPMATAQLQELQSKLQLLESRALALEGVYTRLPADQLVIQQIQQAGVATLQETATTAASRFASIKMTLLALHGAFAVKGVQQLAAGQAKLDQQLIEMRGQLTKEVVNTAANAAGENRLAQSQQIEKIIADTQEIGDMIAKARQDNEQKFEQARGRFVQARQTLATIKQ